MMRIGLKNRIHYIGEEKQITKHILNRFEYPERLQKLKIEKSKQLNNNISCNKCLTCNKCLRGGLT